jgi:hypothetical protein
MAIQINAGGITSPSPQALSYPFGNRSDTPTQVIAVFDNSMARVIIRRQFPPLCSKNHARFKGSRVIQSSKRHRLRSNGLHEIAREAVASRSIGMPEAEAGIEPERSHGQPRFWLDYGEDKRMPVTR